MTLDIFLEKLKGWMNSILDFLKYLLGWYRQIDEIIDTIDPEDIAKWKVVIEQIGDLIRLVIKPKNPDLALAANAFGEIIRNRMIEEEESILYFYTNLSYLSDLETILEKVNVFASGIKLLVANTENYADIIINIGTDEYKYENDDDRIQITIPSFKTTKDFERNMTKGVMFALGFDESEHESITNDSQELTYWDKLALTIYYGEKTDVSNNS